MEHDSSQSLAQNLLNFSGNLAHPSLVDSPFPVLSTVSNNMLVSSSTQVGLTLEGDEQNNNLTGDLNNDTLFGLAGNDRLTGKEGNDLLLGGSDRDLLVGGAGQDGFVYESSTESLVAQLDRIADFNLGEGDKVQLSALPANFYFLGNLVGTSLTEVLSHAYTDKDVITPDNQALQTNEAVLFSQFGRLYLSVNSNTPAFEAQQDLVVDLSGLKGALPNKGLGFEEDFFTTQSASLFEHVSKRWFEQVSQETYPLLGIIDSNFSPSQLDLNYSNFILGSDRIENDSNPFPSTSLSAEHGTNVLGIVSATRNNNSGIDGINDRATVWLGSAIGSGQWAESVIEFVDTAKSLNKKNAVLNLSFELTQTNPDGSVTTRTQLTAAELAALEYAERNQVIIVAAAGNNGGQMSALAQASQEFDNIITVGAADEYQRAAYSNFGESLDLLAQGGTPEKPAFSLSADSSDADGVAQTYGTSIAAAKVTGSISHVWGFQPTLNYTQVLDILKQSAKDIGSEGRDTDTGFGLLNIREAVKLAQNTQPQAYQSSETKLLATLLKEIPEMFQDEFQSFFNYSEQRSLLDVATWQASDGLTASERAVFEVPKIDFPDIDFPDIDLPSFEDLLKKALPGLIKEARDKVGDWIDAGRDKIIQLGDLTALVADNIIGGIKGEVGTYQGKLDSLKTSLNKLYDSIFKPIIDGIINSVDALARNIPGIPSQDTLLAFANNYNSNSLFTLGTNRSKVEGWITEGDVLVQNLNPSDLFKSGNTTLLDNYRKIATLEQQGLLIPSQVSPLISQFHQDATKGISDLVEPIRRVLDDLLGQARRLIDGVDLASLTRQATDTANGLFNPVKNAIFNINDQAVAKVTEISGKITEKVTDALGKISDIIGQVVIGIKFSGKDVTDLIPGIGEVKDSVKNGINNGIRGLEKIAINSLNSFNSFAKDAWNGVQDTLINKPTEFLNEYIQKAEDKAKSLLPTVERFLNPLNQLDFINNFVNGKLGEFFKEIELGFSSLKSFVFDTFPGKIRGWRDSLENFADNAFEQVKDTAADVNKSVLEGADNAGEIIDKGIKGVEKIAERLEDIINNPEKFADDVVEAAKKLIEPAKQFGEWLKKKVVDPLVDEAFGLLEGRNSLLLGLDAAKASGLIPSEFVDKVKDNWNGFSRKIHDILSRPEIDKLPNTQKAQVDIVDGLLYILEGKYRKAWDEGAKDFLETSVGKIIDAGKQIIQGNWKEALKSFLNEFNIELPENQVDRLLESENAIQDAAVQLLAATGISVKTAEAALSKFDDESDGYSNDNQVHGVLNIIGYYNIPYVSWGAKAVDLVYYIVEGVQQVEKQPEESIKKLLTGVLSAVKVQNAADWLDAVFSLKDGIKTDKDEHYINAVGSVLEAVDFDHGKEWVNGAVNLFNGKYVDAISNIIIAAADIEDEREQNSIKNGVRLVWEVVDNPEQALIEYVKNTAKAELIEQFNLVENVAGSIVNITADLIEAVKGNNAKYAAIISNIIIAVADIKDSPQLRAWVDELWMRINDPKQGIDALKQYLETTGKTQLKEQFKLAEEEAQEFVTITTNLVGAIKGNKDQYPLVISNAIIAIADISKTEQNDLKNWANTLWSLVNDPKKGIPQYLENEAKKQLQGLGLNEEELKGLIEISKSIISGKFDNVLLQGFKLAGFEKEGTALLQAFNKFKAKDYDDAIAKLVEATGSKQAAKFIEIGRALLDIKLDPDTLLEFDEPKQKVLLAMLTALDTKNPKEEVAQANDAVKSE